MPISRAIIIEGGISGVAAALALTKHNGITCSIFEIRPEPATIGGATGLTPKALRYLDDLGVLDRLQPRGCEVKKLEVMSHRTGKLLGVIDYDNLEKFKYHGLRVMRHQLQKTMLDTLKEISTEVQYGKKIASVTEEQNGIKATFEDGQTVEGDILLGCDGIHSDIRMKFVQPDRKPEYTGIANVYGFVNNNDLHHDVLIDTSSLYSGRHGSLLLTYIDPSKSSIYFAAVMRVEVEGSRKGWTVKGEERAMKDNLIGRFSTPFLPFIQEILHKAEEFTLYPVYRLAENGVWKSGRMLLLGDAAHAMPPQGESAGLAIEDTMLLSRILERHNEKSTTELFQQYEAVRRPPINAAVKEASMGFDTIQDHGWLMTIIMEWFTWLFLMWRSSRKEKDFGIDVRKMPLEL